MTGLWIGKVIPSTESLLGKEERLLLFIATVNKGADRERTGNEVQTQSCRAGQKTIMKHRTKIEFAKLCYQPGNF